MKVTLKELLSNLGIERVLPAYEADSHQVYDEEAGKTCSAETRMGVDADRLEVEVQMYLDKPEPGELPVQQILSMICTPKVGDKWGPKSLSVKGEEMTGKFSDWEAGACAFYIAVAVSLKSGEIPDIDALIDEHMQGEKGRAGRGRRGGGRKNPKFKPPGKTMSMKQGM